MKFALVVFAHVLLRLFGGIGLRGQTQRLAPALADDLALALRRFLVSVCLGVVLGIAGKGILLRLLRLGFGLGERLLERTERLFGLIRLVDQLRRHRPRLKRGFRLRRRLRRGGIVVLIFT